MWSVRRSIVVCLGTVVLLSSCGGSASPTAQIRSNFERLRGALRKHDARTVCELLFLFGEHQGRGALAAELRRLDTPAGRLSIERQVPRCERDFVNQPSNFVTYEKALASVSLRRVIVHGEIATVPTPFKSGIGTSLTFVRAAGEWRLLIGVQ